MFSIVDQIPLALAPSIKINLKILSKTLLSLWFVCIFFAKMGDVMYLKGVGVHSR
jgi:hypothetical protein